MPSATWPEDDLSRFRFSWHRPDGRSNSTRAPPRKLSPTHWQLVFSLELPLESYDLVVRSESSQAAAAKLSDNPGNGTTRAPRSLKVRSGPFFLARPATGAALVGAASGRKVCPQRATS